MTNLGHVVGHDLNVFFFFYFSPQKLPNSTIHAFEPIPDNLSVLKRIIAKFHLKKIKIHETAVGETEGNVQMILPHQGKTKMQGLSHVKHETITEWNEGDEYNVQLNTLDNLLNGEPIQGIKIDIEKRMLKYCHSLTVQIS